MPGEYSIYLDPDIWNTFTIMIHSPGERYSTPRMSSKIVKTYFWIKTDPSFPRSSS